MVNCRDVVRRVPTAFRAFSAAMMSAICAISAPSKNTI